MIDGYLIIPADMWSDFSEVAQERGLPFICSEEDAEDGGVEYHVYDNIEAAEAILWAVQMLRGLELVFQEAAAPVECGELMPYRSGIGGKWGTIMPEMTV